jgi:outer membrane protein OmpA-like peptidoglycan-associated protein
MAKVTGAKYLAEAQFKLGEQAARETVKLAEKLAAKERGLRLGEKAAEKARLEPPRAKKLTPGAEELAAGEARRLAEERAAQFARAQAGEHARIKVADKSTLEAEALERERTRLRAQLEAGRLAHERAKAENPAAAQQAEQAKAAADGARGAAMAEQQRLEAEADRERTRQELQQQLNVILETRDSARGLIVDMSDVLFDFGKATLKPGARETLTKVAGIVLAHPGLTLEIEGNTDSTGSDEYNQKLSEARADAVRGYLVGQGIEPDSITVRGHGKTQPVASNSTAEGRQRNRRVEMVVSGDIIGTKVESMRFQAQPAKPAATPPKTTPPQR